MCAYHTEAQVKTKDSEYVNIYVYIYLYTGICILIEL